MAMHKPQLQVREFHEATGSYRTNVPGIMPRKVAELRKELMAEEVWETILAIDEENLVKTIDGCLDTLVVTYGTLEAIGFDAEPGFDEVHRANMSKVSPLVVRDDGKILKGPNYSPPNLEPIIERQKKNVY